MGSEERQIPKRVTLDEWRDLYQQRAEKLFQLDPKVPVTLRGKGYTLEFDNRAAKGVLLATGFNMLSMSIGGEHMRDPQILGSLLYHGLKENHPDITEEEADRLLELRKYPYIITHLQTAMSLFSPDMSDVSNDELESRRAAAMQELNPPKPLTGSGSSTTD